MQSIIECQLVACHQGLLVVVRKKHHDGFSVQVVLAAYCGPDRVEQISACFYGALRCSALSVQSFSVAHMCVQLPLVKNTVNQLAGVCVPVHTRYVLLFWQNAISVQSSESCLRFLRLLFESINAVIPSCRP